MYDKRLIVPRLIDIFCGERLFAKSTIVDLYSPTYLMASGTVTVKLSDGYTTYLPMVKRRKGRKPIMRDCMQDMKYKYKEHVGLTRS